MANDIGQWWHKTNNAMLSDASEGNGVCLIYDGW